MNIFICINARRNKFCSGLAKASEKLHVKFYFLILKDTDVRKFHLIVQKADFSVMNIRSRFQQQPQSNASPAARAICSNIYIQYQEVSWSVGPSKTRTLALRDAQNHCLKQMDMLTLVHCITSRLMSSLEWFVLRREAFGNLN